MQVGPEFAFGDAGNRMPVDSRHARLADADGPAHQFDLVAGLDRAGDLGDLPSIDDLDPACVQRRDPLGLDAVHGQPPVAAAICPHFRGDFIGPERQTLLGAIACAHEHPAGRNPYFVDTGQSVVQVFAALEFEHDPRPAVQDQRIPQRIVAGPDAHVLAVKGVADIDRIVKQQSRHVVPVHQHAHPRQPVGAGAVQDVLGKRALQWPVGAFGIQVRKLPVIPEWGGIVQRARP